MTHSSFEADDSELLMAFGGSVTSAELKIASKSFLKGLSEVGWPALDAYYIADGVSEHNEKNRNIADINSRTESTQALSSKVKDVRENLQSEIKDSQSDTAFFRNLKKDILNQGKSWDDFVSFVNNREWEK